MRSLVFLIILSLSSAASAELCDGLFVGSEADMLSSRHRRIQSAKAIKRDGLADKAYVARWEAKSEKAKGPFTEQGEILVQGVEKQDFSKWMKSIGKHSIGIGVYGLPEHRGGTAYLRVGDKFFTHEAAAAGRKPKSFKRVFNAGGDVWMLEKGLTEATIKMTPSEIKAILAFYKARGSGEIMAQKDMKGYNQGEWIEPDFSHTGKDLINESCGAACTSFLSDQWLDNMNDQALAGGLRKIREKYNLNYNYVARANVWMNFRNPMAQISILRIDASDKGLVENFMAENSWGSIRGLYKYAFMPDGSPKHEVGSYRSYRLSLDDYIAGE